MAKKIEQLKRTYESIPVPSKLEDLVEKGLQKPSFRKKRKVSLYIVFVAAAVLCLTISLNTSAAMAKALSEVPVLGQVVKVLTFTKYELTKDEYHVKIEVPKIEGSSAEIQALNQAYEEEGKVLYEQFQEEIEQMEAGNMALSSGYIIQTDNDQLLSFGRYIEVTVVSSSTVMTYTTIDKQAETVITLPSLFKNDEYIQMINVYIEQYLRERMLETNGDEIYWIGGTPYHDEGMGVFEGITATQNFYITPEGKLVLSFNDYEIAPGFMGVVTVEIPTSYLQQMLVSNKYIK
jgi:hypothetical protein